LLYLLQRTDDMLNNSIDTKTDENYSDSLSKPTARTKFYEHNIHGTLKTSVLRLILIILIDEHTVIAIRI